MINASPEHTRPPGRSARQFLAHVPIPSNILRISPSPVLRMGAMVLNNERGASLREDRHDLGRQITMPVSVVTGSVRMVFPELVSLDSHDGDFFLSPAQVNQLAFRKIPTERGPGVDCADKVAATMPGTSPVPRAEKSSTICGAENSEFN
jgi:hypothetical protein